MATGPKEVRKEDEDQETLPEVQKPSFVLSPNREGGQYLFVDFAGDTMSYVDLDTGEMVKCQVFVATLPASDYGFAMAVPSQKVDDFLYALECCLRHIGGVPKIIVTDNLKSAVVKADRYEPEVNRSLEDFAEHFDCVTIPARSGKPKDKAPVEGLVSIVYKYVFWSEEYIYDLILRVGGNPNPVSVTTLASNTIEV